MDPISVSAWGFAFDNLNRNSRFFPKPKDVLEEIQAFKIGATVGLKRVDWTVAATVGKQLLLRTRTGR